MRDSRLFVRDGLKKPWQIPAQSRLATRHAYIPDSGKQRLAEHAPQFLRGDFFILFSLPNQTHLTAGIANVIRHQADSCGFQGQHLPEKITPHVTPGETCQ
jgi:hypothetical protein